MATASERTETVEVEGRRLACRLLGSGPPLLLVNGYAATAADWDPTLLAGLADSFELICPDLRGMGDSQLGDPAQLSIDGLAADLERILEARDLQTAPVAAWSMGGFAAQRLALRAPERVESLVLLGTDPGGNAATLADPTVWARLTDRSGTPREQASRLISLLFPPPVAADVDRRFGEVVAAARAELADEALRAQQTAMEAWHREEQPRPGERAPPVLVLHGEEDVVIPAANAAALAERWPRAEAELFAGGGHAFMAQEPERVAGRIASFLAR
jgi:pimeloyl-ACP methyl ester carboxylesterase